jgi:hypothetical protein
VVYRALEMREAKSPSVVKRFSENTAFVESCEQVKCEGEGEG